MFSNIVALISIIISILAIVLTVSFRLNDTHRNSRNKYLEELEKVYLALIEVYSVPNLEKSAKEFVNILPNMRLNTTYFGIHHKNIIIMNMENLFNFDNFMAFAEEVERRYWLEFKVNYHLYIRNNRVIDMLKEKNIETLYSVSRNLSKWSLTFIILSASLSGFAFFRYVKYEDLSEFNMIIFLIALLLSILAIIVDLVKKHVMATRWSLLADEFQSFESEKIISFRNKKVKEFLIHLFNDSKS